MVGVNAFERCFESLDRVARAAPYFCTSSSSPVFVKAKDTLENARESFRETLDTDLFHFCTNACLNLTPSPNDFNYGF